MSLESKWREAMVFGWKGASVHGRNLGTCAQSAYGVPGEEAPHGGNIRDKVRYVALKELLKFVKEYDEKLEEKKEVMDFEG